MHQILFYVCVVIFTVHTIYYVFILSRFNLYKRKNNTQKQTTIPVSVIVCAKNEAENIRNLLPKLINQNYNDFEIVLINDRSYDATLEVYEEFAEQYDFIKIVNVKEVEHFYGNKKFALTLGIKASKNDCLLFTDADCIPNSTNWITEMVSNYNGSTQIVLGYGPYQYIKYNLLNKLIRYETLVTALQYFSYAKIGIPYMGVGRNLMYSKHLFLKNKGFNKYINIMSGDDDLFINQVATSKNTQLCFSEASHMVSKPKTSLKTLITQKRRHISTAKHYKNKHKILLGLFALNRALFWCIFPLSLLLITSKKQLICIAILGGLKFISEYITVGITAKKLKEKGIVFLIPFLDFFLLLFQIFIFFCNLISKPKKWS